MPLHQIAPTGHVNSETIGSLIRYRWCADQETTIGLLAEELKSRDDIPVVGIVDDGGTLVGIIATNHLMSALGRPYGWDVYRKRSVLEWVEAVQSLDCNDSLHLISERLLAEQDSPATNFYAVVDSQRSFLGLFSQRDLRVAQELQGQLVEHHWRSESSGVEAEGYCEMFKGVGGDFLAVREVVPGPWFGCLCDVSGKGIAASLVTTLLWGILEAVDLTQDLEQTVKTISRAMVRAFRSDKFVSGFFWTYNEATGQLRFADMGHSHEVFWIGNETEAVEDSPNVPLGIEEDLAVVVGERTLLAGDGLFVYSDGVIENAWATKSDFPVLDIVEGFLGGAARQTSLIEAVNEELTLFRRAFPPHDDMSMVWFQRRDRG